MFRDYYYFNAGDHGGVLVAVKYFRSQGETRDLLYSTDEGENWYRHSFHAEDLRIYGLMTEPGENTTVFTMFGSAVGHHQWLIVKVDLSKAFGKAHCSFRLKFRIITAFDFVVPFVLRIICLQ